MTKKARIRRVAAETMTDATPDAMIATTVVMTGATLGAMIEMTATIAVMTGATRGAMTVTNVTTGAGRDRGTTGVMTSAMTAVTIAMTAKTVGTEAECGLTRKYRRRRRDC